MSAAARRVIYAVNAPAHAAAAELLLRQLRASRESLRRHAPALPVTILCFGDIDLGDLEAEVERRGSYEHSL
ncbi:MAG: hypothetical protein KC503_14010, partial [Myxococcales bacterium]|nr:hypothetical protein [Myxococcales bacterium]